MCVLLIILSSVCLGFLVCCLIQSIRKTIKTSKEYHALLSNIDLEDCEQLPFYQNYKAVFSESSLSIYLEFLREEYSDFVERRIDESFSEFLDRKYPPKK